MRTLLNQIIASIQSTQINKIAVLKQVTENFGELQQTDPPVRYPVALVKIDNCVWETIDKSKRLGDISFSVLIADKLPGGALPPNRSEVMSKKSLIDIAEAIIFQLETDMTLPNIEITTQSDPNPSNGTRQIQMSFRTQITRARSVAPVTKNNIKMEIKT